jgi:hypothetical protein
MSDRSPKEAVMSMPSHSPLENMTRDQQRALRASARRAQSKDMKHAMWSAAKVAVPTAIAVVALGAALFALTWDPLGGL